MPLPPGDMVAALGRHLHFKSLEQALCDRHPELADRVHFDDANHPMHLEVTLSGRHSVVLAQERMGHTIVWAVTDSVLNSEPSVWPLHTPDEVLVDALHAVTSARLTDVPVPSPWRWDESEPSDMTELADLLDARGVRVRRVAAGNGYFPYGPRHSPELDIVGGRDGSFVEAEFPDAFVRVSLKPALGWLVDVYLAECGTWGRVDLAWNLWHSTRPAPGVPRGDASVADIAHVLDGGLKAWDVEVSCEPTGRGEPAPSGHRSEWQESLFADEATPPEWLRGIGVDIGQLDEETEPGTSRHSTSPRHLTDTVLEQLTAFGFGDLEEGDAELPIRSDAFHIEWHNRAKNLSTSEVQRLNGLAAAAGKDIPKRLIVITTAGISRPAAAFADTAKAFVFFVDRSADKLMALNSRAREALLPHTNPAERGLEPW
ncbi:hypothetical protein [Streptomyces prunicolor]|uniref:Restriction endonuclease type IV Mrr domain-containing protein n=1 Tax=Streptomyces prunicolor TaxID=67348 RepID=A0ABU4FBL5_9ACTN|nr:hypothetical protein [Streptomyces prunicolor]MDV7217972.1 hypothetical protein [Streptomyces prunicolor]